MNSQASITSEASIKQLQELYPSLTAAVNVKVLFCGHNIQAVKDFPLGVLTKNCSICLEPLLQDKTISKYDCGHIFHEDCAKRYTLEKFNCVECRAKTDHIQNYQTATEYFNFECIECNDEQCYKNKSQALANKITINDYYQQAYLEFKENNEVINLNEADEADEADEDLFLTDTIASLESLADVLDASRTVKLTIENNSILVCIDDRFTIQQFIRTNTNNYNYSLKVNIFSCIDESIIVSSFNIDAYGPV